MVQAGMCIMRVDCKLGDLRYVLDSAERLHEVTKAPNKARARGDCPSVSLMAEPELEK